MQISAFGRDKRPFIILHQEGNAIFVKFKVVTILCTYVTIRKAFAIYLAFRVI